MILFFFSAAYTLTEPDRKASSSTLRDLINEGSATLVPIVPILADLSCKMCEKLDTQESRNKCKLRFCENITSSRVVAETPAQADFRQRVTSLIQNEIDGARTNQKPAVVNALLSDMLCAACEKLKTTTEKSNCRKRHCLQPQKSREVLPISKLPKTPLPISKLPKTPDLQ